VENRPGAGWHHRRRHRGALAEGRLHRSRAEHGHSVSAVMVKNVPYDPVNDFAPIGIFTNSAIVVAVGKKFAATD
jgi:tripartite-type tricarboxylate transporter receptor subunit TctC